MEEVYVTGIGVILPNCDSKEILWTHLSEGDSQLRFETNPASPGDKIPMGRVHNFDSSHYLKELPERFYSRYEREIQMYLASVFLARDDAGLSLEGIDPTRLGVFDGCSRPGFAGWYERIMRQVSDGFGSYSRRDLMSGTPGQAAGIAASLLEARGPVYTFNSACSSGAVAIGHAFHEIRKGNADVCFATGHESSLCAPLFAMYEEGGLLSDERHDARKAVSPYGDSRGNAFGEGAITLVLESKSHAEARGVEPIAQICAYEYGNNGFHPTTPDLAGGKPARLIERCLEYSNVNREDIRFVVGHGNGVALSDATERNYMLLVFGEDAHRSALLSNKPIYGHTLGASSALNVAAAALMLRNQYLAPTITLRADPDATCFDHVPMKGRSAEARAGLSISYGLGGNTTVLLLKPAGEVAKALEAPSSFLLEKFMQRLFATGMGTYLPKLQHTNATLPPLDKPITEEQIARIGVVKRGWAGPDEGIAEMAAEACKEALEQAELEGKDIDLIVLANWTQRRYIPEFAPKLQELIGAPNAFAFDISGACTGFVNGVGIAHHMLHGSRYKRALVVASETTSQRGRPNSKASLVFGDGAAAWVLELEVERGTEIVDYELISDGKHHHIMKVNEAGHVETLVSQKELNVLAAQSFTTASRRVLQRQNLTLDDIDWVVPHSGTAGIQATLIKTLEVSPDKVRSNYFCAGNVSSAAIPISLAHFVREGEIKKGDLILSPTTGTGWYYAAMIYRL